MVQKINWSTSFNRNNVNSFQVSKNYYITTGMSVCTEFCVDMLVWGVLSFSLRNWYRQGLWFDAFNRGSFQININPKTIWEIISSPLVCVCVHVSGMCVVIVLMETNRTLSSHQQYTIMRHNLHSANSWAMSLEWNGRLHPTYPN